MVTFEEIAKYNREQYMKSVEAKAKAERAVKTIPKAKPKPQAPKPE